MPDAPSPHWSFVMVAADLSDFLEHVRKSGHPFEVAVLTLAMARYVEPDTGLLTCSQRQLARQACMDLRSTHRALDALVAMGIVFREGRGKYRVHPNFMWRGALTTRADALRVIEGGRDARKRA